MFASPFPFALDPPPALDFLKGVKLRVLHLIDVADMDPSVLDVVVATQASSLEELMLAQWPFLSVDKVNSTLRGLPHLLSFTHNLIEALQGTIVERTVGGSLQLV